MTSDRGLQGALQSWLHEDRHEDATRILHTVLDGVGTTPQHRPRRSVGGMLTMNKFVAIGLGAAAVVVVLFVGAQLINTPIPVGPNPTQSAAPSEESSEAPSEAEPSAQVGSPVVWLDGVNVVGLPVTITPPSPAWDPTLNFFAIERAGASDPPDGAAIMAFTYSPSWLVPGDACNTESTMPDEPSATVDELVAAFAAQASRDASAPVDITVDGHAGKSITLHVPDPIPADCDNDQFCSFVDPYQGAPEDAYCARTAQGPGQIDELWIVSVDGWAVIIDGAYYAGTPDAHVEEMRAIVDSIRFE